MLRLLSKIRFLPITIFAATLMLTVRIGDIWQGVGVFLDGPIEIARATAQTEPEPTPTSGGPAPAPAPVESAATDPDAVGATVQEDPSRLITDDPTLLTPAEIEILMRLAERRDELEARDRELDAREGLLRAAEIRIERRVAELNELRQVIESRIQVFDNQQEEKLGSLVRIYENMKPKDAAQIFEDLEMNTLLEVAERMKERSLAPIMANLNPQRAREITVELRALRELPRNVAPLQ